MSTKEMLERICNQLDSIESRVSALESKKSTTSKTQRKKSTVSKKSEKNSQTWEDHLTETFGDKETRSKFVELRKKVAEEFKALADEHEVFIPKKSYKKVLNETTSSLNGKFNKASIKKSFLANAK